MSRYGAIGIVFSPYQIRKGGQGMYAVMSAAALSGTRDSSKSKLERRRHEPDRDDDKTERFLAWAIWRSCICMMLSAPCPIERLRDSQGYE
jgi:hypothetical protein